MPKRKSPSTPTQDLDPSPIQPETADQQPDPEPIDAAAHSLNGQIPCAECGKKMYVFDRGQRCTCNNQRCRQYMVKIPLEGYVDD